jgi:hypothetical protein
VDVDLIVVALGGEKTTEDPVADSVVRDPGMLGSLRHHQQPSDAAFMSHAYHVLTISHSAISLTVVQSPTFDKLRARRTAR